LRWSSLTATEGREGLALVGRELDSRVVDGRTYWFGPASRNASNPSKPVVDLVQGYDEIIMAYSETRDQSFRVGGPYYHPVLLDGRLVGHWRPTAKRNATLLEIVLRHALKPAEAKALDAAVDAYGQFVGGRLTVAQRRRK
jgi:hypothetical protein